MIKEVMVVPLNYDHLQRGQLEAFENVFGCGNISHFDFMLEHRWGKSNNDITDMFVIEALEAKPDWIWMQVQGSNILQPEGIRQIKKKLPHTVITHWMGDLRTELPPDLIEMCKVTDMTLISNKGQLDLYGQYASRVRYCQIGLDWGEDVLGLPEWTPPFRVSDVVFIGGYNESFPGSKLRLEAIRTLMAEGIDVGVIGPGWPSDIPIIGQCTVKQSTHVYRRAKVVLSINNFNDVQNYWSDRQLIAMASGTPVVCAGVPGLEEEFQNKAFSSDRVYFRIFDDLHHLVSIVKTFLQNDLYRALGKAARYEVMQNHSWQARILQQLPAIEECQRELMVDG